MVPENTYTELNRAVAEAVNSEHRRMIVITGTGRESLLLETVQLFLKYTKKRDILIVPDDERHSNHLTNWLEHKRIPFSVVRREDTSDVLGTTWDLLIVYSAHYLTPNSLGRLVETVRGGGLILFEGPELSRWYTHVSPYHERLVSPPASLQDVKRRFEKRLVCKLTQHKGIWVVENGKVVYSSPFRSPPRKKRKIRIPSNTGIPDHIYKKAVTQDQVRLIHAIEKMMSRDDKKQVLLVKADRGRGKSAALGITLGGVVFSGFKGSVTITAPSLGNAQTLFTFLENTLKDCGITIKKRKRKSRESFVIQAGKTRIKYMDPDQMAESSGNLAIIDEAAGIPLPLLMKYLKQFNRFIFASTVHGYEGAGRGFEIRFKKRLSEIDGVNVAEIELKDPIRYAPGDPVENWLYDVLLLDSKPAQFTPEEIKTFAPMNTRYEKINLDAFFGEDEDRLKQFVGTYITAHYRNRPDDLLLIGDAPLHFARIMESEDGGILAAMHLTVEGNLTEKIIKGIIRGWIPHGQLIPATILKYYPTHDELAKMKGVRVVRIAVHPDIMGKGLGTHALKMLERELSKRYEWIGASFGASKDLLKFWIKNGYSPVHISPIRNAASGEYSVIMVKPLSKKAQKAIFALNTEFKARFFDSLHDTYYNLPPKIAAYLFRGGDPNSTCRLDLTPDQIGRLKAYAKGLISYEGACDVFRAILRVHFMRGVNSRLSISDRFERALIVKALQGRSWRRASLEYRKSEHDTIYDFREFAKDVVERYD